MKTREDAQQALATLHEIGLNLGSADYQKIRDVTEFLAVLAAQVPTAKQQSDRLRRKAMRIQGSRAAAESARGY